MRLTRVTHGIGRFTVIVRQVAERGLHVRSIERVDRRAEDRRVADILRDDQRAVMPQSAPLPLISVSRGDDASRTQRTDREYCP